MYAYARVTRGGITESVHRVRLRVVRADGEVLLQAGDADAITFLRSAWKPIQALGIVSTGAAEAFGLEPHELAVCCASHHGQDIHLAAVRSVLAKAGLTEEHLGCGPHWPADAGSTAELRAAGAEPTDIHNNCSGKHAGMLVRCAHLGLPTDGYLDPSHPVQKLMIEDAARMCGVSPESFVIGVDGCTAPTWGVPLRSGALCWARLGAAATDDGTLRNACRAVVDAMATNPVYIGGDRSADTRIMQVTAGRIVCKGGAEAAAGLCVPSEGIGLALKVEDGNSRGSWPVVVEALRLLGLLSETELAALSDIHHPTVRNCNQIVCGEVVPVISEAVW